LASFGPEANVLVSPGLNTKLLALGFGMCLSLDFLASDLEAKTLALARPRDQTFGLGLGVEGRSHGHNVEAKGEENATRLKMT